MRQAAGSAGRGKPLLTGVYAGIDQLVRLRFLANHLDLDPRRSSHTPVSGGYFSRFRGRGMEFEESRMYLAGDDIRTMDWKVTARTGQPHTKVFREERQRPVLLVVDFRATMFFGTRIAFKSVIAAGAAALLSWVAAARGDRVGGLIFSDNQHEELRPTGGRPGVLRLLRVLAEKGRPPKQIRSLKSNNATDQTSMDHVLHRSRRVARPGSLIFVLSDFYELNTEAERHLRRLSEHNDVVLCWITDPLEVAPPPPGRYPITDGEHRKLLETRATDSVRAYRDRFEAQWLRVQALTSSHTISLIRISTNDDVIEALRRGLESGGDRSLSRQVLSQ